MSSHAAFSVLALVFGWGFFPIFELKGGNLTLNGVTTHLPNELALKMDGAQACYLYFAVKVKKMP